MSSELTSQQVAAKIEKDSPVTVPGVPKNYPDVKKLVTEDCIKPMELGALPKRFPPSANVQAS